MKKKGKGEVQGPERDGRVVRVKAGLGHWIDEPASNSLGEMGRVDSEEKKAQKRPQRDDQPRGPVGLDKASFPARPPFR